MIEENFTINFIDNCIANNNVSINKICQKAKDEINIIDNKLLELNNLRDMKKKYKNILKTLAYKDVFDKVNRKQEYVNTNNFIIKDENMSEDILHFIKNNNNKFTVMEIFKKLSVEPVKQNWFIKTMQGLMMAESISKDQKTNLVKINE